MQVRAGAHAHNAPVAAGLAGLAKLGAAGGTA